MSDDKFNGLEEFLEMLMGLDKEHPISPMIGVEKSNYTNEELKEALSKQTPEVRPEQKPKVEHFKAKGIIKGGHYQNTEPSGNSEGKMKETPMPEHSATEPSHYKELAIDPLEYMSVNFTNEAYMGFLEGNILKYVTRYKMKNGVEDLKKARYYLDLLIDRQEMREN